MPGPYMKSAYGPLYEPPQYPYTAIPCDVRSYIIKRFHYISVEGDQNYLDERGLRS